ncbi:MAG: dehydrogenase, partial [Verrucomicrobia bacterium]|nr:dehydrogenase [Verrucomicrobiota bacterium]
MSDNSLAKEYDLIVIGSGMGGGTLVRSLQGCGLRIGIVERGGFLPREEANWNPTAVFLEDRYKPGERWLDKEGREFNPSIHYFVGGN